MWPFIAFGVAGFTFLLLTRRLAAIDDLPTRFLLIAYWLRFALAAFPETVVRPLVGPLSINAAVSVVVTGTLLLLIDGRLLRMRRLIPFYALLAVILVSGMLNRNAAGTIEFLTRYLYMMGLAVLTFRAIRLYGAETVLRGLMIATLTPLILQVLSLPLGVYKDTETGAGTIAYIGGYGHEGLFSTIVLGFMMFATLIRWRSAWFGFTLALYGVGAIVIANYRTTIIAGLPLVAATGLLAFVSVVPLRSRGTILAIGATMALALLVLAPSLLPARFDDLLRMVERTELWSQDPDHFSRADRAIFSGRIQLWSLYAEGWREGDFFQKLIGAGPVSWEGRFPLYAHNTFVSWLFEFGVIGLAVLVAFIAYNFAVTVMLPDRSLAFRLAACMLAFLTVNLATMPLWNIEGLNVYGVLLGYAWAAASPAAEPPTAAAQSKMASPITS